jgi:hypothetical protein
MFRRAKHRRPRGQRDDTGLATDLAREHEASVNQVRHEPMPASRHDERDPEAARRDGETDAGGAEEPGAEEPGAADRGDDRGSGR